MFQFVKGKRTGFEITLQDINQIEEKYQMKFPPILAEFYLQCNGATMTNYLLQADMDEDDEYEDDEYEEFEVYEEFPFGVRDFVALRHGSLSFEHKVDQNRLDGYVDDDMLPIAYDQGGDFYYWDKNSEKVYLYYDDDMEDPIFICHTIQRFFEKLSYAASQQSQ